MQDLIFQKRSRSLGKKSLVLYRSNLRDLECKIGSIKWERWLLWVQFRGRWQRPPPSSDGVEPATRPQAPQTAPHITEAPLPQRTTSGKLTSRSALAMRDRSLEAKGCETPGLLQESPRPFGPRSVPESVPGNGGCPKECPTGCLRECPKSVPRVSPECQSVPDTPGILSEHLKNFEHSGARGPKGPGDTPSNTPPSIPSKWTRSVWVANCCWPSLVIPAEPQKSRPWVLWQHLKKC